MKRIGIGIVIAGIALLVGCSQKKEVQPTVLSGNWDPFNKKQIENLINGYGKAGGSYNPDKPPYAVFDWDNTSIFLDIEDATLIYQLENLIFGCTPAALDSILRTGIDASAELADANTDGKKVSTGQLAADITDSYAWLYNHYSKLGGGGSMPLDEVKKDPRYLNFITKVRFLYEAIYNTFSADIAYPWVTYLFAGLDSAQVRDMTIKTVEWQKGQKIEKGTWTSPKLSGQLSGQVRVAWDNGLRLVPEMQELYNKLRDAGFDVWVCSASFIDVIKGISSYPEFGYHNNASHVIAMELERDASGKILPVFRKGYIQTHGTGKTEAIRRYLAGPSGKYGYGPLLVAGDSEGDQNMLSDFESLKIGLIFNRLNGQGKLLGKLAGQAVESYRKEGARYLLQGRNDNTGTLIPGQGTITSGASVEQKLP